MEQMQSVKKTPCRDSRPYCQSDSCTKPRTHYCNDHNQALCDNCSVDFHGICNCDQMSIESDVVKGLDVIKILLNFVQENSERFKASSNTKYFDGELMMFREMHAKIDEKLNASTKDTEFYEFYSIMKEVYQLQKALIESDLLDHLNKIKELRQAVAAGNLPGQMAADLQRILKEASQICDSKCNKFDTVTEEEKLNLKSTTDDLVQTNEPTELIQRTTDFVVEPELQIHVVAETAADERMQKEINIRAHEQEIQTAVFNRIYERNTNKKMSEILEFYFRIMLSYKKDRNLLNDLNNAKLRLPNLRAVQIGYVSDADADLVSFLDVCTPLQLKLFRFNLLSFDLEATKVKFYVRSLLKLVNATTEEVFLNRLKFSEAELEHIVRASCNAERLIFNNCEFHCLTALDFGSTFKYKTKILSLQYCGNTSSSDRKADWISSPTYLDNIIEAISKSGLRDSLHTIRIYINDSLFVMKAQQMLNEKGMQHITAVESYLTIKTF